MQRPQSIVTFERCYLGGWAIGVLNTVINWSNVLKNPQVQQANAMVGEWYLPTVTGIGLLIPLILWYFIARRGSVVAKWIMVVFTALGVLGLARTLLMGGGLPTGVGAILAVLGVALNVYAATRLFRPDAKSWFGERPAAL